MAVIVALTVTACNGAAFGPDPAACKAALQAEYLKSAHGDIQAVPGACKGLPAVEVQRLIAQVRAAQ